MLPMMMMPVVDSCRHVRDTELQKELVELFESSRW